MNTRQAKEIKEILGVELIAKLLNLSPKTVQGYNWQKMSKKVKSRMKIILALVDILRGSYNELGVRLWFERSRVLLLKNKSPVNYLGKDWESEAGKERVKNIFSLAEPLISSAGT